MFSGDIIQEVDGKVVKSPRDVLDSIGLEIGRSMEVKVLRPSIGEVVARVILAAER